MGYGLFATKASTVLQLWWLLLALTAHQGHVGSGEDLCFPAVLTPTFSVRGCEQPSTSIDVK